LEFARLEHVSPHRFSIDVPEDFVQWIGQPVSKHGSTTFLTHGNISNATELLFVIEAEKFAEEGDSGAGLLCDGYLIGIVVKVVKVADQITCCKAIPYWRINTCLERKYYPIDDSSSFSFDFDPVLTQNDV